MTDLITIKERDGRETVDARELHAALEVTTRFNDWIARRIESYGFIEGKDFYSNLSKTPDSGRPSVEYFLTVAMAKELATVENNDKGREVRRYLIQVEEAWNSPELVMARAEREELRGLMEWFCKRVERGEVRSKCTYERFRAALAEKV